MPADHKYDRVPQVDDSADRAAADDSKIADSTSNDLSKDSIDLLPLRTVHPEQELDDEDLAAERDLEAQNLIAEKSHTNPPPSTAAEYSVETRTKLLYLAGYFTLNLVLTIYNKAVLGGFAFPWLLTALHTSFVSVGCYLLMLRGWFSLTQLDWHQNLVLVAFSFLFTLNIAISNVSL